MATFGKINRSASFNPTTAFPLDARYYFDSLATAKTAAQGAVEVGSSEGTYFYGENLVVIENSKATLYLIQPDKTLTEVGSVLVGDNKSIEVADGVVKIKGFGSATAGQQPRIGTNGEIEWYTPSTETVDGLKDTVSGHTSDIANLQETKADKSTVYTKEEINGKISGAYHYKGSVQTYDELPESPESGDVYNIVKADKANGIKAGDNVAWTGTEWDVLGGTVDLSAYATTEAMETAIAKKVDKNGTDRLMTEAEGTKLSGIEAGAQVNKIDTVDTEQFALDGKKLTLLDIAQSKVTGLTEALSGKVDKNGTDRLMTEAEGEKLAKIESGAQANVIENVKINGEAIAIAEKAVNIPIASESFGVIKSATGENMVAVSANGEAKVESINVNTLAQTLGDTLILNGGSSSIQ